MNPFEPLETTVGRRRYVGIVALASLSGCNGVLGGGDPTLPETAPDLDPGEWPMLGWSVDGNPVVEDSSFEPHGLRIRWRQELTGHSGQVTEPATPVVSDGIVVVPETERVAAFDTATGEERWSLDTTPSQPQPCIADGTVYVPDDRSGAVGLAALDLQTGAEQWTADAGAPRWPVPFGDTVYVRGETGDDATAVVAIDAESGDRRWRAGDRRATSRAAVADGTLVIGTGDGLTAFDAVSGDELWVAEPAEAVETAPSIAGETVYVGTSDGVVRAYDLQDGREEWSYDLPDDVETSPAVADGAVFVANTAESFESESLGLCYALDAEDGEELWTFDARSAVEVSPVVGGGAVFFLSRSGLLYAVSRSDGELLWSQWDRRSALEQDSGGPMPVVAGDATYAVANEDLFAFEARQEPIGTSNIGAWTTDGGDAGYTRHRTGEAPIADDADLEFDVGLESGFESEAITGPLFVADGKVIAFLTARDAVTGDVVWRPPLFGWPQVVIDDVLVLDSYSIFAGVSIDDGQVLWTEDKEEQNSRINGANGAVVTTHPSLGTHVLDVASGENRWSTDDHGGGWMPVIGDGVVYVADPHRSERVVGFDLESGDEVASATVDEFERFGSTESLSRPPRLGEDQFAPLLGDDWLFLPIEETVMALDRTTLDVEWRRDLETEQSVTASTLAYDGSSLYCASNGGGITAFDPETGDQRWRESPESTPTDLVVTDDSVYVAAWQTVLGLDPGSGDVQWRREFDDVVRELAPGDDRLFLRTRTPPMEAYDPRLLALVPPT